MGHEGIETPKYMVIPASRWFVGFSDGKIRRPWKWFTKPGFCHVWAATYVAELDHWVFVEWMSNRLFMEILAGIQMEALFQHTSENGTLLEIGVSEKPNPRHAPLMPIYCVSWVQHLIGISGIIITPWQLFCALKKHGGKVIFQNHNY